MLDRVGVAGAKDEGPRWADDHLRRAIAEYEPAPQRENDVIPVDGLFTRARAVVAVAGHAAERQRGAGVEGSVIEARHTQSIGAAAADEQERVRPGGRARLYF